MGIVFFCLRANNLPGFFLCYFLAGAVGKKRAKKKMVRAKSGGKKRWCGQKAGKKKRFRNNGVRQD